MKGVLYSSAFCMVVLAASFAARADSPAIHADDMTTLLISQNMATYKVFVDDRSLGDIDVYVSESGSFVALDSLLTKFKYKIYHDDANKLLQITFADATTLTLNFDKDEYMQQGKINALHDMDYLVIGSSVFLNTSLMNKIFPVRFSLDQAARKLRIQENEKQRHTPLEATPVVVSAEHQRPDKMASITQPGPSILPAIAIPKELPERWRQEADDFPAPKAAPRLPVIVDDLSLHEGRETQHDSVGQDVMRYHEPAPLKSAGISAPQISAAQPSAPVSVPQISAAQPSVPVSVPQISAALEDLEEDNVLVLQPKIKLSPPEDSFVEALELRGILYLPLDDMMALLEFDIKTNNAAGTAEGSFLSPARSFALSLVKGEVEIDHHAETLEKDSVLQRNGHVYVSAALFEKWFGIKPSLKRQTMVLNMDSDLVLPLEARHERHQLWQRILATTDKQIADDLIKVQNPYQLLAWPSVDVDLATAYGRGGKQGQDRYDASYAVLAGGDLGYMTTNFFATGSVKKPVTNLRLTMGRKDPDGDLLGALHATNFSFGDIESPTLANVTSSPVGRGVLVTNRALNAASSFDTHTITGNAVPGWEVELYQNKTLLSFQAVGGDGRYSFVDIPLLYGNNDFRVVLYGPQGQTEDRTETILVGSSMLKENKFEYTFSANQKELQTLGALSEASIASTAYSGLRAVLELRYGVTKYLTTGVGLVQTSVPQLSGGNSEHHYASLSVDTALGEAFVNVNAVRDLNGGWMTGVTALGSLDDISIRMRHRQFSGFISETEPASNQHKTDSEISANGQFYVPVVQDYNLGFKVQRETFPVQPSKMTYNMTFAKSILGTSFSNKIDYVQAADNQMLGTAGWQARFHNILLRADGHYQIKPKMEFLDTILTTQYRLSKDVTAQTKIDNQMTADKSLTLSQSFNFDFNKFRLSLAGDVNNNREAHVGLNLVFSFAHDPVHDEWRMQRQGAANSGSIATRIYADEDYSGLYDDKKKIIAEARPRVNKRPVFTTDNDGNFISPVAAYEPMDISVDTASLKDPMLSPASAGYRVMTRPGDVVLLDLPVISTSEIDGEIKIEDDSGTRLPLPDIVVALMDSKGEIVKQVMSEGEGYFIFQKIRPGDYTLIVPAAALAEYAATLVSSIPVKVGKASDFYTGNNLLLHTKTYQPARKHKTQN